MKNLFVFSIIVVFVMTVGCGKKEGVVPAKHKLDYVMAEESRFFNDEVVFHAKEYVEEKWTWDGKRVIRIDYRDEQQYSENFFYDGRRIIRTTVPAYSLRSEFEYDGGKLEKIDVYKRDRLAATMSFVHDDYGVNEIVCRCIEADSEMFWPIWTPMPMKTLVGSDVANALVCDVAMLMERSSKSDAELRYALTWDKAHESVVSVAVSGNVGSPYAITLTYDDKKNPYNQLFANHELNESIFGLKMLSEHNVTSVRRPFENREEVSFIYTYTYEGDYPASRELTYSYNTTNGFFDTITVRCEKTEKYYYK